MISIILGTIAFALGVAGLFLWWDILLLVLAGMMPISFVVVGVIAVIAGVSSIKESSKSKEESKKD
ncbi:MAG: hypothetical protein ABH857_00800 [Elusimicrobiota bacterium]